MISYNTKKTIGKFVKYVFLLFITVISLLPIVIVLSSSFKNESEIFDFPFHLVPRKLIFSNFAQLSENFPLYIWNSIKLTSIITILQLFSASTGGYVFSKMQWKGRNFIFGLYLASVAGCYYSPVCDNAHAEFVRHPFGYHTLVHFYGLRNLSHTTVFFVHSGYVYRSGKDRRRARMDNFL